ncbi:DegT/DnrJ/EryC1/StrS family aminotransferase [Paenibacillus sp. FSL R7-0216]|uniref:DegT/DnrJ/EryC1/StrS family aminotransferase n=1 Tax=Paenibacillus sp. FSL R7-0216 TaxID=2921677 RepID=UPI0030DCE5D9
MINVTKTYLPDREKYKKYVDDIFDSGWLTNNGKMVQKLQGDLEQYLGVKNLLLVSNGTLALQVAYKILDLKGEIITTPYSFVATTSSIVWEGLTPKFVDIDEQTLCLNPQNIEDLITENTSAIVATHVYGNVCDVEKIQEIADSKNLRVIYDAAHAFGVKYKDQSVLNYGDISILSFHSTKVFHTIEGGALIIPDDNLFNKAKKMINFGIEGPEVISELGINAKMNEFQAAMGLCMLDDIDEIIKKRQDVFNSYLEAFYMEPNVKVLSFPENSSQNYSYFPVIFQTESLLKRVIERLHQIDVNPRRYFYPSLDTLDYVESDFKEISNSISDRVLCLPLYDSLSSIDQRRIIHTIKEAIY